MFGTTVGQGVGSQVPNQMKKTSQKKKKPLDVRYHEFLADYGGCGHWRVIWPQMILNSTQSIIGSHTSSMILEDSFYRGLNSVRLQRQVTPVQLKFVKHLRTLSDRHGFKLIYEVDDIFVLEDIPKYNSFRTAYESPKLQESAKQIISMVDLVTVVSEPMKSYYSQYNKNIQIVPNYPPKFWLDGHFDPSSLIESAMSTTRPRVMYSGSSAHFDIQNNNNGVDDFSHLVDAVIKTADKYHWVFIGAIPPPLHGLYRDGKLELHEWCNIYNLPAFISTLNINAFIAPLHDNVFNQCKSDIKIVEAGGFGIPCICQDIITYKDSPLKFKTGDELIDTLDYVLSDIDVYSKYSREYNNITKSRWLDDNLDKFTKIFS